MTMKFNKNDILTCVTSDQAVVGTEGWAGNVPSEIKDAFLNPHELVELTDVRKSMDANYPFCVHDPKMGTTDKAFWLPAPYEYLQSRWVSANEVKFNDVLRVVGEWPTHPEFSDYNMVDKELTFDSALEHSIFCHGEKSLNVYVPYYALEKIKDPGYRPFAGAEEYKPHRGEYIQDIESGAIYLPLGYKESGVLVGAEWVWYSYLFEHCVFADTGEPVGVKL